MPQIEVATESRLHTTWTLSTALSLVVLFSAAAVWECMSLSSLTGGEIWSHLRLGSWILEHRAWPQTALFSQASQLPWTDFNWGYDAFSAVFERIFGLRAISILAVFFRIAIAVVTFLLAGGSRGRVGLACVLSALSQFVFWHIPVGPQNASLVFMAVVLLLALQARSSQGIESLKILPALFWIWANVDLAFVYGIGLLALLLASQGFEAARKMHSHRRPQAIPVGLLATVTAACVAATLVTPYGYHSYESFFVNVFSDLNRWLPGYAAIPFRRPEHYVLLLLAMGAALWLGIQRSRDLFLITFLVAAGFLSFHSQTDSWLVVLVAVAVIGIDSRSRVEEQREVPGHLYTRSAVVAAGVSMVLTLSVFFVRVPSDRAVLLARVAATQPVRACDYLREHHLTPPLFDPYAWAGFVMWYLPEYPVSIDERRGVYPEDQEITYFRVMNAQLPYQALPSMKQANTLLMQKTDVMAEALRSLPEFRVVYEDDIAVVLSAQAGK